MDLQLLDLVGAAQAVASKKISAVEMVQWSLDRLKTTGIALNAVFQIFEEEALVRARLLDQLQAQGQALGLLHGVPLAHKDLYSVAGRESHVGSKILRGRVAASNAKVIDLLEAQGEVNLASLHMCEFALSPTGFNLHYGHGKNPWNPEMCCGGSSSGSGIAVAARLVYGSLGSDTGGSIRHPSAMCGVTGLKTTAAFISEEGVFPLAPSLDVVGPMAQTARDCARILTVISEHANNYEEHLNGDLRGVRIGIPRTYYRENVDQEMVIALDLSLDVLRHRGAQLVEVEVPDMSFINSMMVRVMAFESLGIHREWLKTRPEDYAEQVRLRIELGHTFTTEQYQQAMSARKGILENFVRTSFANCDVLHVPTIQVQTPSIADSSSGTGLEILQKLAQVTQVTKSLNYLGLPGMSVPAGFSKVGMPLAFQLIGRSLDEALLLKIADAYQSETSWHKKIPQLQ